MTAIKIKDLREALKQDNTENIKTVDYNGLLVEIKQYLPMIEKITLVSSIYESAVNRDNGLHVVLGNALDIAFKNLLVTTYTNITLPKNTMESYNLLCESGLYDFIYNNIPENEILAIKKALNNHIQAKQDEYEQKNTIHNRENSIENIIKTGIDELLKKMDKFIKSIPTSEEIENMPDIIKNIYERMKSGIDNLEGEDKEYAETITKIAMGDVIGNGDI